MNCDTMASAGLLVLRLVVGASLAVVLTGAGRFSADASLDLPRPSRR
jgi:uncharacterized membrane protein YphA (DoxX/SURF4 family)